MPTSSEANKPTTGQDDDHSWPQSVAASGVIGAGPDLDIIPAPAVSTDEPSRSPSTSPSPPPSPSDDPRLLGPGPVKGPTGMGRRSPSEAIRSLFEPPDRPMVAGHVIEFGQPRIWLWRRLVGACFCYVLVSFVWYLIKLPSGLVSDETLPSQVQVAGAFHQLRRDGLAGSGLGAHVSATMGRFVAGLGIGSAIGLGVGLVGGASPLVRTIVDPMTALFRTVPALAVGPIVIVWFGAGEAGIVAAVAFAVSSTVATSVVDWRTAELRSFAPLPSAPEDRLPVAVLVGGARAAALVAWTSAIVVETVVTSTGLGPMVWFAQGRADLVLAGVFVIGSLGLVVDTALRGAGYLITNHVAATAQR